MAGGNRYIFCAVQIIPIFCREYFLAFLHSAAHAFGSLEDPLTSFRDERLRIFLETPIYLFLETLLRSDHTEITNTGSSAPTVTPIQ